MRTHRGPHSVHIDLLLAIVIIGVVFGSLYPFDFHVPQEGAGAIQTLVDSWSVPPGRGDALANILFYMPFGLFATLSLRHRLRIARAVLIAVVVGALLSTAMELAQYFDEGRVTSASDVYTNTLGTAVGAVAGSVLRFGAGLPLIDRLLANPIPTILLVTWLTYRLFPYEPTIDLHKYWHTIKPLLQSPTPSFHDLSRHTIIWLSVFALVMAIVERRRNIAWAVSFAAVIIAAKVLIIDASLSIGEIVGAALALCLQPLFVSLRRRGLILLAVLLISYIVTERLEPFTFLPAGRPFGWVPFVSFMSGSIEVGVLAFFEKVFLYGSWIFLTIEAGMQLRLAALSLASLLFATSWIETYLPGRSAEVTDAVMALLIAAIFSLLRARSAALPLRRRSPPCCQLAASQPPSD